MTKILILLGSKSSAVSLQMFVQLFGRGRGKSPWGQFGVIGGSGGTQSSHALNGESTTIAARVVSSSARQLIKSDSQDITGREKTPEESWQERHYVCPFRRAPLSPRRRDSDISCMRKKPTRLTSSLTRSWTGLEDHIMRPYHLCDAETRNKSVRDMQLDSSQAVSQVLANGAKVYSRAIKAVITSI